MAKSASAARPPSGYPEFAACLVELGIDSISLNPDTVLKTMLEIAKTDINTSLCPQFFKLARIALSFSVPTEANPLTSMLSEIARLPNFGLTPLD